jgi:5-(carboxyamino)imidazole ribonucleotide synthase
MDRRASVLEGFVDFTARSASSPRAALDGQVAAYDPGENVHRDGILRTTTVPAACRRAFAVDAVLIAARILNALDYVGVMGVELFVTPQGLVVNEIAPRVHNSGHWTQAAARSTSSNSISAPSPACRLGDGSAMPMW